VGKWKNVQNVAEPQIKRRTVAVGDKKKPQRVAYLSLYGVRIPEDIDREILFALHPELTSKAANVVGSVLHLAMKVGGVGGLGVPSSERSNQASPPSSTPGI